MTRVTIVTTRTYKRCTRACEMCQEPATRAVEVEIDARPFEPYILCDSNECWNQLAGYVGASTLGNTLSPKEN